MENVLSFCINGNRTKFTYVTRAKPSDFRIFELVSVQCVSLTFTNTKLTLHILANFQVESYLLTIFFEVRLTHTLCKHTLFSFQNFFQTQCPKSICSKFWTQFSSFENEMWVFKIRYLFSSSVITVAESHRLRQVKFNSFWILIYIILKWSYSLSCNYFLRVVKNWAISVFRINFQGQNFSEFKLQKWSGTQFPSSVISFITRNL